MVTYLIGTINYKFLINTNMEFYNKVRSILEGVDMTGGVHSDFVPIDPNFDLLPKEIEYIDRFSSMYVGEFKRKWNDLNAGWVLIFFRNRKYHTVEVSVAGDAPPAKIGVLERILQQNVTNFNKAERAAAPLLNQNNAEGYFQKTMLFAREKTFRNIQLLYNFEYEEYKFGFGMDGVDDYPLSIPYTFSFFEIEKFQKRARALFAAWLYVLLYDPRGQNMVWDGDVLEKYKKIREVHTIVSKDTDETFGQLMDEL